MDKSIHFSGQPLYSQVIKLLDKSKILQISRKHCGEHYVKRFDGWTHLVVMLYAVIMHFDSLREIMASVQAEVRIQNVTFSKMLKDGTTLIHHARIITYVDTKKHKLLSLFTDNLKSDPNEIIEFYRKRWEIELLFKQIKQNFPLKYFYGESANTIKIQIWMTLITNLLLMVMKK